MKKVLRALIVLLFVFIAAQLSSAQSSTAATPKIDLVRQQWNGDALCYSGYRGPENPDKNVFPTQQEVLQDLTILSRHWHLLRVYASDQHGSDILKVIREHRLPIKVMLGIWLTGAPGRDADNEKQIVSGIALAQQYPEIVAAVSVGNEALVSWSDHKMSEPKMIDAVARVRKAVHSPVTVDDDFLYWIRPDAALIDHVDFIALHTYPVWGKEDIDTGFSSTVANYEKVLKAHPGKTIVLGEVGWPSYSVGEKHVPRAGDERKQKLYFEQISTWAKKQNVTVFLFEAFDEPWKGEGTEGHWGIFTESRKAKPAVQELYPDLKPTGVTSPAYNDAPKTKVGQ